MSDWPLSEGGDRLGLALLRAGFAGRVPERVGVAVSGGGDSLALLHMAIRARPHLGWQVFAVTVDHGLRPESAEEAAGVAAFCASFGVAHQTLRWQGPEARGNLMDQARRARLALIGDWARARGIGHVLMGHTADDDAEGFLMNLAREAGIDGLSGMRAMWQEGGVAWHRPLLPLTRAALRAYLVEQGMTWVEDPSNDNPRFARVKARRALAALAPLGITVERLSQTIAHLADARQGLDLATAEVAARMRGEVGMLELPVEEFAALSPEIARRLLSGAIRWMGGAGHAPRGAQLGALQRRLAEGTEGQLGGVCFRLRKGRLLIVREPRAVMGPVALGEVWDHRWQVTGPEAPGLKIAALGAEGLRQGEALPGAMRPALRPDLRPALRAGLLVSPGLWRGEELVAAPLMQPDGPYQADLSQGLAEFILSH